jgi:hypothetical protein
MDIENTINWLKCRDGYFWGTVVGLAIIILMIVFDVRIPVVVVL